MVMEFLIAGSISGLVVGELLEKRGKAKGAEAEKINRLYDEARHGVVSRDFRKAIKSINNLIKVNDEPDPYCYVLLGLSYEELSRDGNISKNLKIALKHYKTVIALSKQGIHVSYDLKKFARDAIKKIQSFLTKSDEMLLIFEKARGRVRGSKTATRDYFEKQILSQVKNPKINELTDKAIDALRNSRFKDVIKYCNELIKIGPFWGEYYTSRAIAKNCLSDRQGALEDFKLALKYDLPEFCEKEARINVLSANGLDALRAEKYDDAIAFFDEVVRMDPARGDAVYNRGVAKEGDGDDKGAMQDFRMTLKLEIPDQLRKQCEKAMRELSSQPKSSQR